VLRFQPDGWLEGLLRPLILGDPSAGIYFERAAPDFRYAWLLLFLLVFLVARRGRSGFGVEPTRVLWLLAVCLYVWTFVIGNARYFAFGLLLVGPLLVMTWRRLPGTRAFRLSVLLLVCASQAYVVHSSYMPNAWGIARWAAPPGLSLEDSPLRRRPAVFLTVTTISYSALVPLFHPGSRWANVSGQIDLTPERPEFRRVQELVASGLPPYIVAPILPKFMDANGQPSAEVREYYGRVMAPWGLAPSSESCSALRSTLPTGEVEPRPGGPARRGFWLCPLTPVPAMSASQVSPVDTKAQAIFARVEAACPRYFPSGAGTDRAVDGVSIRHYVDSDMRLYLDGDRVLFRYFRAINPTLVGSADDVLAGRFSIPCDKVPGRYRFPWEGD